MKFRNATIKDLPAIVAMLADDELGSKRENYQDPLPSEYYEAFNKIDPDPDRELIVLEDERGEVIGTLHLTFIPYLTYQGGTRAQVEAVRVRRDQRGKGLGKNMFEWVIARAKERGAHLLQLTTDKQRPDTVKFYEELGFKASHVGMKLHFK